MTPAELQTLKPYFRDGERYLNGTLVDWSTISYETMFWIKQLREHLGESIRLIRGAHPNRPSAVDFCCPDVPMGQLFLALTRVQRGSWGIYSGASAHLDTREFDYLPARWLAVKESEDHLLKEFGLRELEASRKDGWIYLNYSHPKALDAVNLICRLAEGQRTSPTAV